MDREIDAFLERDKEAYFSACQEMGSTLDFS